jgi:uncharacterized protein YrrD
MVGTPSGLKIKTFIYFIREGAMLTAAMKSLHEISGYKIHALDGEVGKAQDFYFDDAEWIIRYLVVDTGNWLSGRKVLLSPSSIQRVDEENKRIEVTLAKEIIEASPDIDADKPVSRQQEMQLSAYYAWPGYWGVTSMTMTSPDPQAGMRDGRSRTKGDPNLRSAQEVKGYHIRARDGEVGHVEDFLVNEGDWSVPYAVVDTKNWLPGKKVLVSPFWIDSIDWAHRVMNVDLEKEMIESSPDFDLMQPFSLDAERRLFNHYGKQYNRR